MRFLRAGLGVFIALLVTTVIAEGIEYVLVTAEIGTGSDQDTYFATRNRPPIVLLKFLYNPLAALIGGWLLARVTLRNDTARVAALAATVQAAGFLWGMLASQYAGTAPLWAWPFWLVLTSAGIVVGARWSPR